MNVRLGWKVPLVCLVVFFAATAWNSTVAEDELVHMVSGVVKHMDKGTKTMVVKAADGTEHTIKYTAKTTWEGTEESGKAVKEGSQVTVKYTEKSGEKTAVGVKKAAKATVD